MRVLIADDNETSRKLGRLTLASEDREVVEAVDGAQALEKREAAQRRLFAADGELERSEKSLRELVELAPIGIFEAAPDGILISANTAFARMLGFASPEELIGLDLARDVQAGSADRPRILAELSRPDRVSALGAELRRRDGSPVWVEADGRMVKDATGSVVRFEIFALDVTERKRAERETQRSEERYRFLFENNPQSMWVFDEETLAFLAVNEAACSHYGYTRPEFLAMRMSDIRPPEDVPPLEGRLSSEPPEPQTSSGRRHCLKDGTVIEVEITSHPLVFGNRPARLILANDVTERRRSEEALRDSEQRFRQVTESIDEVFWLTDLGGDDVIYISPAYERIWGRSCESLYADPKTWLSAIHPGDQERVRHALTLQATGGYDVEFRILRPDGSQRWIHERAFAIRDAQGAVYRVAGVAADVTARRRAQAETLRSEERFRRLFDSNTIGIAVADLSGTTTEANDAYLDMLGYTQAEVRAALLRWDDITPPEFRAADEAAVEALRRTGVAPPFEKELFRKDGTRVPVLLGMAMLEASEAGCIAYIVDVSRSRRLEEQLRQSQKMEAIGQLAGGVAHDFNNLLTAILGYTELAVSQLRGGAGTGFEELEEVRKAAERAALLTRQLLAFSRRQVLEPRVLDLNGIIVEVEKMLRRLIGEDVNLATALAPCLGSVRADAGEIEQVIMNLAVNARDAMPEGGRLTIETANVDLDEVFVQRHVSMRPGPYVLLTVSDTGAGMTAETQTHMFEPFFTTKARDKGTGLGLSTVYGIVKQSGGWIWVYSEPGRGSSFKIYLPRVDETPEALVPRVALRREVGTETILLAEDEEPVRNLARQALEELGYTVLEAPRAEAALSIAQSHAGPIHLVVTDVVMPEMGGVEFASRVLKLRPQVRVLYMSGYTDDAIIRHRVLDAGTHFLQKPFSLSTLGRKVREALA